MVKIFTIIGFLFLISLSVCEDKAGLKLGINDSTIASYIKYLSPQIMQKISSIPIQDQYFKEKGVKIWLWNIHMSVQNFTPNSVVLKFVNPNVLNVKINNLRANGGFRVKLKWLFISTTKTVTLGFNNINVDLNVRLTSRIVGGKKLINMEFINIEPNFDLDFHISGLLGKILNIVKRPIRNLVSRKIKEIIRNKSGGLLQKGVEAIPQMIKIGNKGFAIDYSFIENPKIRDHFLLINSYGAFINKNIPDTTQQRFPLSTGVKDYNPYGKQVQIYLSEYVINTAFYTMYRSKSLNISVKPEFVPQQSPVKLTTRWLSVIINGLDEAFGQDLPCEIEMGMRDSPKVEFEEKYVNVTLPSQVIVNVRVNTNNGYVLKQAIKLNADYLVNFAFQFKEEGNITAHVNEIRVSNTSFVESAVPKANSTKLIEDGFNKIAYMLTPFLNTYIKQYLNITLPTIQGLKFNDMTVTHKTNYIAVEYNLNFARVRSSNGFSDYEFKSIPKCLEVECPLKMNLKEEGNKPDCGCENYDPEKDENFSKEN